MSYVTLTMPGTSRIISLASSSRILKESGVGVATRASILSLTHKTVFDKHGLKAVPPQGAMAEHRDRGRIDTSRECIDRHSSNNLLDFFACVK